ncbi:asparagine synthase [Paenibacillus swuensis]|uniref:asparagine synthase (glutamine-hydrolyzing) n=1 Tax=Paenibacillus swuensis TaxID=1178515 RepID=A0A172TMW6_9BACL|nr:asparagine synthase (glutamine-hydrolyzing) [Paenibacillus swuensis]ANE48234.1 asparagine synthase [Paenibacillus swuensis]
MCGIAGIVYFNPDRKPSYNMLQKMTNTMTHRGPDQNGIQIHEQVGLAFNRLSILDLEQGAQPMPNEDSSIWLVFNGEIYNYQSLRMQLEDKGHIFRTHTDSEVILHLYEEYKEKCLEHLQGMFSFAIWNIETQELFAARDHFGVKPFYYYQDKDQFIFASEIKSILTVDDVIPMVNANSLMHYLTFQYVPHPETMFEGIRKLEPGYYIHINKSGKVTKQPYWAPAFEPENRPIETFIEELRHSLKKSVKDHMHSEVPLGCFLSGGIDSSSIASYVSMDRSLKTFSVGFAGEHNETVYAAETAAAIGSEHYEELISPEVFFADTLEAVWHMDEPIADPAAIPTFRLSKLAREQVTVVLSGEGADELFGGYGIYREPSSLRPISWVPDGLKSGLERLLRQTPGSFYGKNYLLRGLTPLEGRFVGNAKIFSEDEKKHLVLNQQDWLKPWVVSQELTRPIYEKFAHLDEVSQMQTIDLNFWLPNDILMVSDKMSMAHSLELRVPFLDKNVFEIARKIPHNYRLAQGTTKYVLRKAMEGIVPDHVLSRPKLGFPVPLRKWLHTEWGDQMLEQIKGSGSDEWFRMEEVKAMLNKHRNGQGDYSRKLWTIYIFSLWHATYIKPTQIA